MSAIVTNRQLRQLLSDLGFTSHASVYAKCAVFEHAGSGARLLLPANRDDEPARQADVLSLRTHLYHRGHLEQDDFDIFLEQGAFKVS